MRTSTLLPWLLFGPLLTAILAGLLYELTRWSWLVPVVKVALAIAVLVMLAAFIANWRAQRRPPPPAP